MLALLRKEFALELRRKTVLAGIALYLASTTLICYLSFSLKHEQVTPATWSALLWVIILFTIVNVSAKSFMGEKTGTEIYFYSIASATAIIFSKIVYNTVLSAILAIATFILLSIMLDAAVSDVAVFSFALLLGASALASTLTTVSAIASKANNNVVLMAVLGLPVVVSIVLPAVKVTRNTIDGLDWSISQPELFLLLAINCLIVAVSFLLFPYIWRS